MKGQSSVEFMIFIGIMMMILAVYLWSNASIQNRITGIKTKVEAQELSNKIAFEINTAVRAGDGYEREFYVEDYFFGVSEFDISVGEYSVFIDWYKGSVISSIVVKNITGTINKGQTNIIENKNEVIYVS